MFNFHKRFVEQVIFSSILALSTVSVSALEPIDSIQSQTNLSLLAEKIYQNECHSNSENLLFWSEYEAFPSLGLGHFIWFPKNSTPPFEQTFPEFLRFVQVHYPEIPIPVLVANFQNSPWHSRKQFYELKKRGRLEVLQEFLEQTLSIQANFIVHRFEQKIISLVETLPDVKRRVIEQKIKRLKSSDAGLFALIDYANFKGFGDRSKERYQGVGWGLLQVLDGMRLTAESNALAEFKRSAKFVLQRRIQHSKNQKENVWKAGWFKRIDAY